MSRPAWLQAALDKHVKPAERAAKAAERGALQAALASQDKAVRDAAKATIADKVEAARPDRTPPAKKR